MLSSTEMKHASPHLCILSQVISWYFEHSPSTPIPASRLFPLCARFPPCCNELVRTIQRNMLAAHRILPSIMLLPTIVYDYTVNLRKIDGDRNEVRAWCEVRYMVAVVLVGFWSDTSRDFRSSSTSLSLCSQYCLWYIANLPKTEGDWRSVSLVLGSMCIYIYVCRAWS